VEINKDIKENSAEIMVVDDSNFNLKLMSEILLSEGFKVSTFKSGDTALAAVKEKKPDLILLDVNMPGISGYEVCHLLKADKDTCDIPVLFVSALIAVEDKINGFNAGGIDFISKPFYPEEVVIRVKTHLKMRMLQIQLIEKNKKLENALNSLSELQVQLVQKDKMASVGQLSAGIAHEINNPLGFVSSNFNTLKKYMDKFKEYIFEYIKFKNDIEEGSITSVPDEIERINYLEEKNKIDFIIDDLDDLYKDTEDGLNRIKEIVITLRNFAHESSSDSFEEYSINQGITDTLVIAKNELKYEIQLNTNLFPNISSIKAKPGEINQGFLNIILNSSYAIKEKIKQNPTFNGILNIVTWNDNDFVYCSIEDNGIGIPKENTNKIFNPFFTTKPVGEGTGLGLSISYDIIVNKHKGDIRVVSIVGEGTKIIITLPINKEVGD